MFLLASVGCCFIASADAQIGEKWRQSYLPDDGSSESHVGGGVAVAPDGNVFVAGNIWNGTDQDLVLLKYDGKNGQLLWEQRDRFDAAYNDYPIALAVDAQGNPTVCAMSLPQNGPPRHFTAKHLGKTGAVVWQKPFPSIGGYKNVLNALAIDRLGNVIVAGATARLVAGEYLQDALLIKYASADGAALEKRFTAPRRQFNAFTAVATAPSGTVAAIGTVSYEDNYPVVNNDTDILVARYSEGLDEQWSRIIDSGNDNPQSDFLDRGTAVAFDPQGNICFGGELAAPKRTGDPAGRARIWISKVSGISGQTVWSYTQPSDGYRDMLRSLAIDAAGNVCFAGYKADGGNKAFIITKLDQASGQLVWQNADAQFTEIHGLALSPAGAVVATGVGINLTHSISYRSLDYFTVECNGATGATHWARYFAAGEGGDEQMSSRYVTATQGHVAISPQGRIYVTGGGAYPFGIATVCFEPSPRAGALTLTNHQGDRLFFTPPSLATHGIHVDTRIESFGSPSINSEGALAFVATLRGPAGVTVPRTAVVVAKGDVCTVLAAAGGEFPDSGYYNFVSFKDPILADDGSVLFSATVTGSGLAADSRNVVCWSAANENPQRTVAAPQGAYPFGPQQFAGATFSRFTGLDVVAGGKAAFAGLLKSGRAEKVTPLTDAYGLAWDLTTGLRPGFREGEAIGGSAMKKPFSFVGGPGSLAQGRGWFGVTPAGETRMGVAFSRSPAGQGFAVINPQANTATMVIGTGEAGPGLPAAPASGYFTKLGLPNFSWSGSTPGTVVFRGQLKDGREGIFHYNPAAGTSAPLALTGSPVPGYAGAILTGFIDPVLSADGQQVAWQATIKGPISGAKTTTARVLMAGNDLHPPAVIARVKESATGLPGDTTWKAFTSLAIASDGNSQRGVLFTATLAGGISAKEDSGLWGSDSTGNLMLLAQEGASIGEVTLKKITALTTTSGAPGVSRSFTPNGKVAVQVTTSDGQQHLGIVEIP